MMATVLKKKKKKGIHGKESMRAPRAPLKSSWRPGKAVTVPGVQHLRAVLITSLKASEGPGLLGPTQAEGRRPTNGALLQGGSHKSE